MRSFTLLLTTYCRSPSLYSLPTAHFSGAALSGHAECIRLLLEAGAAVDQCSERGKTPLMEP